MHIVSGQICIQQDTCLYKFYFLLKFIYIKISTFFNKTEFKVIKFKGEIIFILLLSCTLFYYYFTVDYTVISYLLFQKVRNFEK